MAAPFWAVLPQVNAPVVAPPLALSEPELNKIRLCLETYYYPSRVPLPGDRHMFHLMIGHSWNDGRFKHHIQQCINIWDYCQSLYLLPRRQAKRFAEEQFNRGDWTQDQKREAERQADLTYYNQCDQELTNYFQNGEGMGNLFIANVYNIMLHNPP